VAFDVEDKGWISQFKKGHSIKSLVSSVKGYSNKNEQEAKELVERTILEYQLESNKKGE
jgi:hypothetical protein